MGCLDEGRFIIELENGEKHGGFEIDLENESETIAIEDAVKVLLLGLGEDINREGIKKTPLRVAKALRQGTRGYGEKAKDIVSNALFPESGLHSGIGQAGGAGGLVIVRDVNLFSYCESCLLPFQVKCHVAYVPSSQRVVGLSKLARVADVYAKRLQEPKRMADEICSALQQGIKPAGIAVILQCMHIHFPSKEAFLDSKLDHQGWAQVNVHSGSGVFESGDASFWEDFYSLLKLRGITVENTCLKGFSNLQWCPYLSSIGSKSVNPSMINAVDSMLRSLGEDPTRKALVGTPTRFVRWMMNFQNCKFDFKINGFCYNRMDRFEPKGDVFLPEKYIHSELNLSFWSQCEHHLLPFYGVVHIGYFCGNGFKPLGKSLLQSIVHFYGFKLQVQERLTRQIAEAVSSFLGGDVIVVVEADHTCMISRGIEKVGSNTATVAKLGRFSTDSRARTMFLQSISMGGKSCC